jgi:DNA-binding transcriptional regulator LsrR (DeoR family)
MATATLVDDRMMASMDSMPTKKAYTDAQLILAARLYYADGLSQAQVAKMVGASQAKVSRMLSQAREQGIVRISVPEISPRDESLEQQLCQHLGLSHAVVVRRLGKQTAADLRSTVGYFAAPVVSGWLRPTTTLALAGGRTVRSLAERMMPPPGVHGVTVVQSMGNVDEVPGPYDALEFGRILAQRWGGSLLALNTPALLKDAGVCRQFLAVDQVRKVFERLVLADLALVGVGNLQNSVFLERRILKPRDIEVLKRSGAVGEICGRFYDASGKECETPFRHRVISIGLDKLRRIEQVVGVVSGSDRTDAILGAIRGRILKSLVIDDVAAQSLLNVGL